MLEFDSRLSMYVLVCAMYIMLMIAGTYALDKLLRFVLLLACFFLHGRYDICDQRVEVVT